MIKLYQLPFYGLVYRTVMKLAHRFNWHYMPPCYPDKDTMLWCHWCGARYVLPKLDPSKMLFADAQTGTDTAKMLKRDDSGFYEGGF